MATKDKKFTRLHASDGFNPEYPTIDFRSPDNHEEAQRIWDEERERYMRGSEQLKDVQDAFHKLTKLLNNMNHTNPVAYGLARQLLHEHRTLQPILIRQLMEGVCMFIEYIHEEGFTDARNEDLIKFGTQLRELLDNNYFRYI